MGTTVAGVVVRSETVVCSQHNHQRHCALRSMGVGGYQALMHYQSLPAALVEV
jgi:hypothetical protein